MISPEDFSALVLAGFALYGALCTTSKVIRWIARGCAHYDSRVACARRLGRRDME